jgi:hypothetical protein
MTCGCSKPIVRFNELDAYACAHFGISPDPSGLVRWARLNWRGVPLPLRIVFVLRAAIRGHQVDAVAALDAFTGCGCIDRLKRLTERLFPA